MLCPFCRLCSQGGRDWQKGYMTWSSDSWTPWEDLAELLKWDPPFSGHQLCAISSCHCLLVYGVNKCCEFLEDPHCCPGWGNGRETQREDLFKKDMGCITGVASQTCPPVSAAATEMLVPLAFLPYPGMMRKAAGTGRKIMRSVGNGSGTTSTRNRWVCAKWVGVSS